MAKTLLDFDLTQMYFGLPYKVNDYIEIKIPYVYDIIKFGEKRYFSMITALTCIPSDMKSQLFDAGIDYEMISDFELFCLLVVGISKEDSKILFNGYDKDGNACDIDFSQFVMSYNTSTEQKCLCNYETGQIIDELAYIKISEYLRIAHSIVPKIEKAANKTTKNILIELDREKIKKQSEKPYASQLVPLISSMMRYPGFKYKSSELNECTIYEFMDTIKGANIYVQATALISGSYSGMIDTSKIDKKQFNWMRADND